MDPIQHDEFRHDEDLTTRRDLITGRAFADEAEGVASSDDLSGDVTLHAERLVGGVERHEWARVKVTRRIVTEERTVTVPVRREELVVEYLGDQAAPDAHTGTVRGSTEPSDSRVVEEFVLHEEVPRVELDMVPREKVRLVVDQQRSLVELSDTVRREQLDVQQHQQPQARRALHDDLS